MNDEKHMQTAKKLFRELAPDYPPTKEGIEALIQDPAWRAQFPSAAVLPDGRLALATVDVLRVDNDG